MEVASDSEPMDACTGLEIMTQEAVALFQDGQHQEALTMATQFALAARNELGRTNPVHINALATVAALVDQMGGSCEADALLLEAEDLQDEMEMEVLGIDLYADDVSEEEDEEDHVEDDDQAEKLTTVNEPNSRPLTGLSDASNDREPQDEINPSGGSQNRSSTATTGGGSTTTPEMEFCSDDEDSFDEISAGGSESESSAGSEGCSEGTPRPDDDDENSGEAEAEAITRLSYEVNALLSHDRPEEAARLLSEAETILADGGAAISELGKAALHTLWASVLSAVGEEQKAQHLYAEAMHVLQDVSGAGILDSDSTSEGDLEVDSGSESATDEEEESEEEEGEESEEEASLAESSHSDDNRQIKTESEALLAEELAAETPSPLFATEPELDGWKPTSSFTAADILLAQDRAAKIRESMKAPVEQELRMSAEDVGTPPVQQPSLPQDVGDVSKADSTPGAPPLESIAAEDAEAHPSPASAQAIREALTPTPPPGVSPKRRRPPPLAPQPVAKATTRLGPPAAKQAPRCGGGFSAPKKTQAPKAKAKAKAKARAQSVEEAACDDVASTASEEAVEAEELAVAEEPCPLLEELPAATEEPPKPLTAEQQREVVEQALTCAEHFVGLMQFERAADKLEEQLVALEEEDHPHRHGTLHIEVMMKYGGVLWWDKDPEGAVDAYTAAEEMLIQQPSSSRQSKQRTEIWTQAAQVCRGCGDLDSAKDQLSHAVFFLTDLVKSEPLDSEYRDSLNEAKASLAQVCVERKEYEQAEQLYMEAFGGDAVDTDDSDEPADICKREDGGNAQGPAESGGSESAAISKWSPVVSMK